MIVSGSQTWACIRINQRNGQNTIPEPFLRHFVSLRLGWVRNCIFNKYSDDAGAPGLGTNFENHRIGRCTKQHGLRLPIVLSRNVPFFCSLPLTVGSLVLRHDWGCPLQDITPASNLIELISLDVKPYYVIIFALCLCCSNKKYKKTINNVHTHI